MPTRTAIPTSAGPIPAGLTPDAALRDDAAAAVLAGTGVADLSDADLFDAVATVVARPKEAPADSFVLHAPLEVLARWSLLAHVAPSRRAAARDRIVAVALRYHESGAPLPVVGAREHPTVADGVVALGRAISTGDLEAVDPTAAWLSSVAGPHDLLGLVDVVVPSLSAAGHGSILLELLARAAPRSRAAVGLLRPVAREAARHPDWSLTWQRGAHLVGPDVDGIVAALLATPRTGRPGSDFIYPLMHHAETSGIAPEVVPAALPAGAAPAAIGRALAEVASLSMLLDDVDATPYGWTHCLTIPQAIASVAHAAARPDEALAIAATHVVGFRTALSVRDVPVRYEPSDPGLDPLVALGGPPSVAAAAVRHARPEAIAAVRTELASYAAAHEDAHLAKCTLALLDAGAADPASARLHLSAAAHLSAWWRRHDAAA